MREKVVVWDFSYKIVAGIRHSRRRSRGVFSNSTPTQPDNVYSLEFTQEEPVHEGHLDKLILPFMILTIL
jgi:hypothetical protein